jgi:hypothetical protein
MKAEVARSSQRWVEVDEAQPLRAKWFIPCIGGRCPGQMQLRIRALDGSMLPRPFYICDRRDDLSPCAHSEEPLYADSLRSEWVESSGRAKQKRKKGDRLTHKDMETML